MENPTALIHGIAKRFHPAPQFFITSHHPSANRTALNHGVFAIRVNGSIEADNRPQPETFHARGKNSNPRSRTGIPISFPSKNPPPYLPTGVEGNFRSIP
jgi:hypothetical protein